MAIRMGAALLAFIFAAATAGAQEKAGQDVSTMQTPPTASQQDAAQTGAAVVQPISKPAVTASEPEAVAPKPTAIAPKTEEKAVKQETGNKKTTAYPRASRHLTMEEIVVTDEAERSAQDTVVGVKTIEKGRNTNVPDALKNEADIDIKRRANVGDTADMVGGYYIDWGTIPLDNIERLEIIRGGSSAIYGNNALGGVINVITRKPTEKPTRFCSEENRI